MTKPKKLSLTKAFKYYKVGFPTDSYATLDFFKNHAGEGQNLVDEMTAVVYAPTLEEACKVLVKCGYGADGEDDPSNWRSHVEPAVAIRRAAGHFELDYSPKSIVKDLLELVRDVNDSLNEYAAGSEVIPFNTLIQNHKEIDSRIELVYGRLLEE